MAYVWFMGFNVTFNNVSVSVAVSFIGGGNQSTRRKPQTWRSVLLVEETGVPGENHRPVASD